MFVAAGLPTPADALSKRGSGGRPEGKKVLARMRLLCHFRLQRPLWSHEYTP